MMLSGSSGFDELEEEGRVSQEINERETKGLTITKDRLVSRTNYELAVGARFTG